MNLSGNLIVDIPWLQTNLSMDTTPLMVTPLQKLALTMSPPFGGLTCSQIQVFMQQLRLFPLSTPWVTESGMLNPKFLRDYLSSILTAVMILTVLVAMTELALQLKKGNGF